MDDGKKPSRWNKCRFRCAICGKLSSEKRHIREHIIKLHGLALPDYERQYGDCEIHTEYFFCGVCHAEVKHNLKNISLHLQNVHALSPGKNSFISLMQPSLRSRIHGIDWKGKSKHTTFLALKN